DAVDRPGCRDAGCAVARARFFEPRRGSRALREALRPRPREDRFLRRVLDVEERVHHRGRVRALSRRRTRQDRRRSRSVQDSHRELRRARRAGRRPVCMSRRKEDFMKAYVFAGAPNPRKLIVYLREKGLEIPLESVDILSGANRTPEFLKRNPLGGLPVLELDDGSHLTESLAIMEYFEDLHPAPPMIGTTPLERARVRELERICELGVLSTVAQIFQNTHPFMAGRLKQSPDAAENARNRLAANLKVLDAKIGGRPFVAGSRPSIADCTLFAAMEFAEFAQVPLDPAFKNVTRWYAGFKERPSAQA